MHGADNSRPDGNGILRDAERPPVSRTHLTNDDTRVPLCDASPRAFRHRFESAVAWLTTFVERARSLVSQKRTVFDSSASAGHCPTEIAAAAPIVTVTADDVIRRMKGGERFTFVDARTIDEWIQSPGQIERSIRMSVAEVAERLKALPRERTIVTYGACPEGEASSLVALELTRLGVADVHPLAGGLAAWRASGGPVETV